MIRRLCKVVRMVWHGVRNPRTYDTSNVVDMEDYARPHYSPVPAGVGYEAPVSGIAGALHQRRTSHRALCDSCKVSYKAGTSTCKLCGGAIYDQVVDAVGPFQDTPRLPLREDG